MRLNHLFIVAVIFLLSCSSPEVPSGTFYAVFPCADCGGISYELTLNNDNSYTEKLLYQKAGAHLIVDEGSYDLNENEIHLTLIKGEGSGMKDFKVKGKDELVMLDLEGEEIESKLADMYRLTREKPANFSLEPIKARSNLLFKGFGNEPSWSLDIELFHSVKFQSSDDNKFQITAPLSEPDKSENKDAISYHVESESGILNISIFNESCEDGMSDSDYSHKVIVLAKSGDSKIVEYKGCGRFPEDSRLNDIWALESINDKPVTTASEVPSIEFQVMQKRIFGFSGCNRMTGSIDIHDNILHINNLGVTRMACQGSQMELENKFLDLIRDTDMSFGISNLKLTLTNIKSQDKLIFKKVD